MSEIAQENLRIYERGHYIAPSGKTVDIASALHRSVQGTCLYRPQQLEFLLAQRPTLPARKPHIAVTSETTGAALRRLAEEGVDSVVALNFASARHPGGGFLGGAKAQEEDLCRASCLYPCLLTQPEYYEANRLQRSAVYTDHMIYSPNVPFIRDESGSFLETIFTASIITAPAPNAGAVHRNEPNSADKIVPAFQRRIRYILAIAAEQGHRTIVLGAWGCGAFRNEPWTVAPLLRYGIEDSRFSGAFDTVVMAIYDNRKAQHIRRAFDTAFQLYLSPGDAESE